MIFPILFIPFFSDIILFAISLQTVSESFPVNQKFHATTVREEDRRGLLDTLRQFATLNAARVQSERRALLFDDSSNLFRAMRDDPILGFSMADIGEIAGRDKSTVSRQLGRAVKSGEGEVING